MDILSFLAGVLYYETQSLLALCFCAMLWLYRPLWRLALACCLGYGLGLGHQWWTSDIGMPQRDFIAHAKISGKIASIPNHSGDATKLMFDLQTLNARPVRARIQLGCYRDCPELHAGQSWALRANIHRPHHFNNPGGFDSIQHLAVQHIHWQGSVVSGSMQLLPSTGSRWQMLMIREKLTQHFARLLPDKASLGIAQALTIGVTTYISQADWTLFRCTGTTHLMVISGAHIGLVAGMLFKAVSFIWTRIPYLCLRYPAQKVASIAAILGGFGYAALAGFGVPAERSAIAACFIFLRYLGKRAFSAWQAWRYALCAVLCTEPHAVEMPGFYLSFIAVAILLTMNQRIQSRGIKKAWWIQVSCMLGLLPFTLFWFAYGAVNGLLANVVAIPWVSFLVVPLALLCLGLGQYLPLLPSLLQTCIHGLLWFLHQIDSLAWVNLKLTYSHVLLPMMGILGMALYLFLPVRALWPVMMTCLIVAVYPHHPHLPQATFRAQILDVGQGLAVLILTHDHALLYDTGGQLYHGQDLGQLVILPYFQHIGLRYLDKIIVSHPDLDHRGGLGSIQTVFPHAELIVDNPSVYHHAHACHTYSDWTWDGIHFHFFRLHTHTGSKNNSSCVLQVSNSSGKLLLTGDIEARAERELIRRYGTDLQSTVLVVPHHGSKIK